MMPLAAFLLALTALASPVADDPPFGFAGLELYKLDDNAVALTAADLNADGRTDFAAINNAKHRIEIFLQKTPEQYEADRKKPRVFDEINQIHDDARFAKEVIALESDARALAAADFTGDGKIDLAYLANPGRVFILERVGDRWTSRRDYKVKDAANTSDALLAADLDNDGRTDLAVLKKGEVAVLYQRDPGASGAGGLRAPVAFPTGFSNALGLAFVKPRDDRPHLVLYRRNDRIGIAARALLPKGLGPELSFETGKMSRVTFPSGGSFSIISVTGNAERIEHRTVKRVDRPDAKLSTPPEFYPVASDRLATGSSFGYGDVNGDGLTDVLLTKPSAASVLVFLQAAGGVFNPAITCSTFAGATCPCVGDFDGDGTTDVLVVSAEERAVGVARWAEGRLGLPTPITGLEGKPLLAVALPNADGATGAAIVTEVKRTRTLTVIDSLAADATRRSVTLAMKSPPTKILPADLDGDGDQDFVVLDDRGSFTLVRGDGKGGFESIASDKIGGAALLKDAETASFQVARLPSGRDALLSTKKTIGRALALDDAGRLAIQEQYNAGEDAKLTAIARLPEHAVAADRSSGGLVVLTRSDTGWQRTQEIDLTATVLRGVHAIRLDAAGTFGLVVVERNGFHVLRPGATSRVLEPQWTYTSETEGAKPWLVVEGDFNADRRPDFAVTDYVKRGLEFIVPTDKIGGEADRALRFEMFEEKSGYRTQNYVREMVRADLNADGKDDLVFLLHDRVLLYLQD